MEALSSQEPASKRQKGGIALLREQMALLEKQYKEQMVQQEKQMVQQEKQYK